MDINGLKLAFWVVLILELIPIGFSILFVAITVVVSGILNGITKLLEPDLSGRLYKELFGRKIKYDKDGYWKHPDDQSPKYYIKPTDPTEYFSKTMLEDKSHMHICPSPQKPRPKKRNWLGF